MSLRAALLAFALLCRYVVPLHAEPPRIVSLAPHLTELAFAAGVGDRLVGAVEWSDYPEAAAALPRIGDAFRFDFEAVMRLNADTALAWADGTPAAAIDTLQRLGLKVHSIRTGSLDEIGEALRQIGRIGQRPRLGERAAMAFGERVAAFSARAQAKDPKPGVRVFYQISKRPLFTLGGRHVINEIFRLCGAVNIFETVDAAALTVDVEAVLARAPLAILAGGQEADPGPLEHWRRDGVTPAARCGHLRIVDPDLLVRPTPRILEGAAMLCDWLDQTVRADPRAECRPESAGGPG